MFLVLLIACLKGNFMFLVWVLDKSVEVEFGRFGFYFWICPLPKNHLLGVSCLWLIVPYLRGLCVTTSFLQTGLRYMVQFPQLTPAVDLSVVGCSSWDESWRVLLALSLAPWVLDFLAISGPCFSSHAGVCLPLDSSVASCRAPLGGKRTDGLEPWKPPWRVLTPCSCSTRAACRK